MPSNPQYIEKWVNYLRTADRDMSRIAAQKLAVTGDPEVVPELVNALTGRPDDVRAAAIRALGEIGHNSAVPALIKALGDNNIVLASAAADALGQIADPRAVRPLVEIIKTYKEQQSRHTQVHGFNRGLYMAAIYALEKIGTPEAKRAIRQYHK